MKAKNVFLGLEVNASVQGALKGVFSASYPRLDEDKLDVRYSVWLKSLFFREEKVLAALGSLLFGGAEAEVKARAFSLTLAYPEWRCVAVRDLVREGRWFLVVTEREPLKKLKKGSELAEAEASDAYLGSVIGRDFYGAAFAIEALKTSVGASIEVDDASLMAA